MKKAWVSLENIYIIIRRLFTLKLKYYSFILLILSNKAFSRPKMAESKIERKDMSFFYELLQQEVNISAVIYDRADEKNVLQLKLKQIVDETGVQLLHNLFYLLGSPQTGNKFYIVGNIYYPCKRMDISSLLTIVSDKKMLEMLNHAKYNADDVWKNRLTGRHVTLDIFRVKHVAAIYGISSCDTLEHFLITMIEARIQDPCCGQWFDLESDYDFTLFQKAPIATWAQVFRRDAEKTVTLSLTKTTPNTTMQENMDEILSIIRHDIYYSSKTQKLYTLDVLEKKLEFIKDLYELKIKEHCELFKLRHINIYILQEEIEHLLYFSSLREKVDLIHDKLTSKEGVNKNDAYKRLICI